MHAVELIFNTSELMEFSCIRGLFGAVHIYFCLLLWTFTLEEIRALRKQAVYTNLCNVNMLQLTGGIAQSCAA